MAPFPDEPFDELDSLAFALMLYFDELEAYRQTCIRHAPATAIITRKGALRLEKKYRYAAEHAQQIRQHARRQQDGPPPRGQGVGL
jgi:hypothetical protein